MQIGRWRAMWSELGVAVPEDALFEDLLARYREPHRRYHTLQHLDECLEWLDRSRHLAASPAVVELALWFHDAIYDVCRHDNEERSAEWAREAALGAGLSAAVAAEVFALVVATRHHGVEAGGDTPLMVDVDLAILGAAPERFEEYERQIREEYAWVPGFLFRRKRRKTLREFLERPRLYNTDFFHERLDAQARRNLRKTLGRV